MSIRIDRTKSPSRKQIVVRGVSIELYGRWKKRVKNQERRSLGAAMEEMVTTYLSKERKNTK